MKVERIDDIPIIFSKLCTLEIENLINTHFPVHGNRQGCNLGTLCCVFLAYIISESDHRLSHVEDWYARLSHTIGYCTGHCDLNRLDFTDDRLGTLLDYLSDDACYMAFEASLNRHIVSVYCLDSPDIGSKTIHLDATIGQSYKAPSSLFSIGYAKHRRKDLPQFKAMLSTLGTFGLPLCVDIVNGSDSDDILYLPMVERVSRTLACKGLLFVGDSKLGSTGNRSTIAQKEHYYLTPLSKVQLPFETLKDMVATAESFIYVGENGDIKSFEQSISRSHEGYTWWERLITAYSPTYGASQIAHFDKTIAQTYEQIATLTALKQGKTAVKSEAELRQKIDDICHKTKTQAFFDVRIETITTEIFVRKYGNKPAQTRLKHDFKVIIKRNIDAIDAHKAVLGWRVYATNAPQDILNTHKVIEAYKDEYKVEYRFNQLHNKTAALMPIYLQKDERIKALVRILMIAIKVLSLIQYEARESLKKTQTQVKELFPGNPGRKTDQPTAEMILRAFTNVSLVIIGAKNKEKYIEISEISNPQKKLLDIIGLKTTIYDDIAKFFLSNLKISET
jgi:transposase